MSSDGTNAYAYTARGTLQSTTSAASSVNYSFDAFGQNIAAGSTVYSYDALGRVTTVGSAGLLYTGAGNQIASDNGVTLFSHDPAGQVLGVKFTGSGSSTLAWTDQHDDLVARFGPTAAGLTAWVTFDPLGNKVATSGTQVAIGYQSGYTSNGQVNMAARWYNPATGQFTSKDSAANNPVPNSANANPFAYGNDGPLTGTDPSGHRACGADGQCFGTVTADHGAANEARAYDDYQAVQARTPSRQIISQYASNEFDRCGARMGCFNGRLKALQSIKVGKDGHTLTGDPAAVADLNSVVNDLFPSSDQGKGDQHKQCNLNPLTWGGCAHDTEVWVAKHPLIKDMLSVSIGVVTALLCTAATGVETGGASVGGCVMLGAAAASGFSYAVTGDASGKGSVPGLLENMGVSALAAGASLMTGDAAGGAIATATRSILSEGLLADTVSGAATGAVSNAVGGALLGAGDYAAGCESNGGCSWTGMLKSGLGSAAAGALGGAIVGGAAAAAGASSVSAGCPTHSFTGDTPVLMSDGATKPIDQIKAGDKVANAAPDGVSETHTVKRVIVTTTDHDFAGLTITPIRAENAGAATNVSDRVGNGLNAGTRTKLAGAALAAALVLAPAHAAGAHQVAGPRAAPVSTTNLTTTYHHEFYDASTNQWTQAENLHPGDLLQTPTGYALLNAVHLYHADTITYDLTIGDLHTYYVVAGSTPVLVHNCTEGEEGSPTAAEPTKLYRAPHAGNKDAEEFGLDPANHPAQGRHPGTAYLGDTEGVAQQYAAQGIYEDGYWEYTMKPEFESEFPAEQYRVPHDNKPGEYQWIIPQGEIPRFNNLIQGSRWINYYEGYTW